MKAIFEVPILFESGAVKESKYVNAFSPASAEAFVRAMRLEGIVGAAMYADLAMVNGIGYRVFDVICADLPSRELRYDRDDDTDD